MTAADQAADALSRISAALEDLAVALRAQGGKAHPEKLAYRVPEAAAAVGLSERTMWKLVQDGEVASVTVGSARIIPRTALLKFLGEEQG